MTGRWSMMRMRISEGKERKRNMIPNLAYPHNLASFKRAPARQVRCRCSLPRAPRVFIRPFPLHPQLYCLLLESMRRDVRILLVGDGSSLFYPGPCTKT